MANRFSQHNGLTNASEGGCKYKQIQDYFQTHEMLGYTVFVQSPFAQACVFRNRQDGISLINDFDSEESLGIMKEVEGTLIESYNRANGKYPLWNKMGGSLYGQKKVNEFTIYLCKAFSNPQEYVRNPFISKSTIRELSANPLYAGFEIFLQGIREIMLISGKDFNSVLTTCKDDINYLESTPKHQKHKKTNVFAPNMV